MNYKHLSIFVFCALILPFSVKASNVVFNFDKEKLEINEQHELKFYFNRESEEVNAIEGTVLLPLNLLTDIKVKDGGSTASLWVQKPDFEIIDGQGIIKFSAINPAGINGYLFSILFIGKNIGKEDTIFNGSILLADGKGTRKQLDQQIIQINLTENSSTTGISTNEPLQNDFNLDKTPPEPFSIYIAKDPKIFDNKTFAVFNTQDKDSGIAFYEILETNDKNNPLEQSSWLKSNSPYVFKNPSVNKYLFVKAVDKNGNYTISTWENPQLGQNKHNPKIYVIIILGIILLSALMFELYLNRNQKNHNINEN